MKFSKIINLIIDVLFLLNLIPFYTTRDTLLYVYTKKNINYSLK